MRKHFLLFAILFTSLATLAQTRGVKIGYIDMEYILQNVPDYTEAKNQLELKAQKWKQDIEVKKTEVNTLKDALKTEQVLLTKELIDERQEGIKFLENELLDYQQKRFGPNGDLLIQKAQLIKPIQDQVFTAIQDISEVKKYDFIFDKSSDLTMLFAAKRFDISDQVIRTITRSVKREQMSKKQLKAEEDKENKENLGDANPAIAERQKILDERKLSREKLISDRKIAADDKKKATEDKRKQVVADKSNQKNSTTPIIDSTGVQTTDKQITVEKAKQEAADNRAKILEDRKNSADEKKKLAAEKRKQILADREAAKATQSPATESKNTKKIDSLSTPVQENKEIKTIDTLTTPTSENKKTVEEIKKENASAKAKTLEDRKKTIEDKKKKALEEREALKKVREEKLKEKKTN